MRSREALAAWNRDHPDRPAAPYAVNQIVHRSNDRFEHDMEVCAKWKVPIVITSLGARVELNEAVHSWGGITLHDIIDDRFARKAIEKGADGIIAVAAGAGGHAGRWSPFALDPGNPRLVRRAVDPVGSDCQRRLRARRRGCRGRPRLRRLARSSPRRKPTLPTDTSRRSSTAAPPTSSTPTSLRAFTAITFDRRS